MTGILGRLARLTALGQAIEAVGTGDVAPGPLLPRRPDLVAESGRREAIGAVAASQVRHDDARYLRADQMPEPYGPDRVVFGPR